jgi:O-antigen/teichoic acid export membrane protein
MTIPSRRARLAAHLGPSGFVPAVAKTAFFTIGSTATAAFAGLVVARTLGAGGRGEYAAVTAWFGAFMVVGELGQMAATCFYVAREPERARDYLATSRTLLLVTGAVMTAVGLLLAPVLGGDRPELVHAYNIGFLACLVGCVGIAYIAGLQGRHIGRWNLVRGSQPALFLAWVLVLLVTDSFTLTTVLWGVVCTIAAQTIVAHVTAVRSGLGRGRTRWTLGGPLARYGVSQLAAVTPLAVNTHVDQLILSQTVPLVELGHYAVAVSMTTIAVPFVAAIGYVAFPRLASPEPVPGGARRLQLVALAVSAGAASALLVPLALVAQWLVPAIFGPEFESSVPLIWILTPGGVFLACGQVAGDLLRGRNRPLIVAWAQGIAAVLTVVLLVVLLPFLGVTGAAIASTVAYGCALAVMLWCILRLPEDPVPSTDKADESSAQRGIGGEAS